MSGITAIIFYSANIFNEILGDKTYANIMSIIANIFILIASLLLGYI